MCVVSMVGDHFIEKWDPYKKYIPNVPTPQPLNPDPNNLENLFKPKFPTREEFNELKKEVEELKKLLVRAKEYDEKNNEPNCEIEEKMKFLKEVAKLVGVDLDEVLKSKENGS